MVTVFTSVYSAKAYSPLEKKREKGTNDCVHFLRRFLHKCIMDTDQQLL